MNTTPTWIITGAGGFLGSVLTRTLADQGERVRACIFGATEAKVLLDVDCEIAELDVTNAESVARALRGAGPATKLVHCAGIVSIASRVTPQLWATNVAGTRNVLAECRRLGVSRFLYISSVHALTEHLGAMSETTPISPDYVRGAYAQSKAAATTLVLEEAELETVVLFPSGLIGPGDPGEGHLTRMMRDLISGSLTSVVPGGYDIVDVRDVVAGIIAAARHPKPAKSYVLSGHFVTMSDLAARVAAVTGRKRLPSVLPMWFAKATSYLAEAYYKLRGTAPLFTRYSLDVVSAPAEFSHAKATSELGYLPRPLDETIADTVADLA
ncbi:dihydroflavonol-4-reductase [Bowdeniella nasicola]|uniref:Dihydroflavonol-4-reductase n=1 Tax=Bowdeniella nasicola TaxID=208480 RepID=A0A1H3Z1S1_9ACTO|nr:NAD-dependent epimerase/dehydratase family protein [Bowdeniella nasicola]SEA17709.1 dihydroflavonol-4-reductase [Bowdeniella nasicola]